MRHVERLYVHRIRVIREEYSKGRGGSKRAAKLLGISPDSVRQYASHYGIAKPRKGKSNAQSSD